MPRQTSDNHRKSTWRSRTKITCTNTCAAKIKQQNTEPSEEEPSLYTTFKLPPKNGVKQFMPANAPTTLYCTSTVEQQKKAHAQVYDTHERKDGGVNTHRYDPESLIEVPRHGLGLHHQGADNHVLSHAALRDELLVNLQRRPRLSSPNTRLRSPHETRNVHRKTALEFTRKASPDNTTARV